MTKFVVDASIAVAWFLQDESTEDTDKLLRSLSAGATAEAPVLLQYEVVNAIVMAYTKRKRITREICFMRLRDFEGLRIRYDSESPGLAASTIAHIAEIHELSVYDAAYLELAIRKGHPLASADDRMRSAATKLGITLL